MNWEPRCDDTASTRNGCEKNIMRSSTGAHWTEQPLSLFANDSYSTRYLDSGQTHQGPLLPQGESALVLYFAENRFALGADMALINNERSVLQIAPVALQVIPTPSRVLDRISPIFSPFFPVFCAFSPS